MSADNGEQEPPQPKERSRTTWMIHVEREVIANPNLSTGARVLYAILRGYQGKNCHEPFPSLKTLANQVGCVRQIVQKYLNELEGAGLIVRTKRRESGQFCSNKYQLPGLSPQSRKLTTVDNAAVVEKTVVENLRSEENRSRESGLLRIPIYKESHSLKESQREKIVTFSSLKEAEVHYTPLYPEIPVKHSLKRMRADKEKKGQNYRHFLNTGYLDGWFAIEKCKIPPKPQMTAEEPDRERKETPNDSSEPTLEPSPETMKTFAELRANAGLGKNGSKTAGLPPMEDESEDDRRKLLEHQCQELNSPTNK